MACSDFLYWFKGPPPCRAGARVRPGGRSRPGARRSNGEPRLPTRRRYGGDRDGTAQNRASRHRRVVRQGKAPPAGASGSGMGGSVGGLRSEGG
ncbi:hypothetical protein GCM10009779_37310 [Polymorphospora rubra]|uniref:Uncharacterized protein n=1 Tax=Polymorphospora rubra TaxID=338584 RepID=A0A810MSS4_9ACTN|nr:hypothetical protein Prubr_05610 [Polymorphospora rubra]